MNFKLKWVCMFGGMFFGCVFTLMGFIFATAVEDVTAQNLDKESVKFDTVECRRLNVVDDSGKAWVQLWFDDDGGVVAAIGKDGVSFSGLFITDDGGFVRAGGKDGVSSSTLGTSGQGGFVSAKAKDGRVKTVTP